MASICPAPGWPTWLGGLAGLAAWARACFEALIAVYAGQRRCHGPAHRPSVGAEVAQHRTAGPLRLAGQAQ